MIINTRPEKQARRLGYRIEQAELNYLNIPITDIAQRNFLSKDEISNLKKIEGFEVLIFTSIAAVKYGIKIVQDFISIEDAKFQFMAVGPSTLKALSSHGINAMLPDTYDSAGLMKLCKSMNLKNILVLSASNSEMQLCQYGKEVCYVFSHDVVALKDGVEVLKSSLNQCTKILIYSKFSLDIILKNTEIDSMENLQLILPSNRLVKLLPESLKKNVIVAKSALDEDMFQAIQQ
tara:strand:+ start:937 stop:1638 length:702 start_codon:yes stop_codon:yes gene_type:complete